jgi:hypothetical protein
LNIVRSLAQAALAFFRTRAELAIEILALRHQLRVLQRSVIVKPATVIKWHRAGFRRYWAWRSRAKGGRPALDPEVRTLIKRMATANLWGAPRIHGELLKLGIQVSEATVSKYMTRRRKPPSQTWRTFLENHVRNLISVDFFMVPTVLFNVLVVFVVLAHGRRRILSVNVTSSPSAEWTANQIIQAFPWDTAPRYLLRDRDKLYGAIFRKRVGDLGIKEVVIAPRSPWQSPYVERVISARSGESCWTTRSCSMTRICGACCDDSWPNTIILAERICRSARILPTEARSSHRSSVRSSSCRWWGDSVIGTRDGRRRRGCRSSRPGLGA